jgi:hypothetical protein
MRKVREVDTTHDGRREALQQKVRAQMEWIEGLIEELMEGVVMSELTSKDRLLMAVRFAGLYQGTVQLEDILLTGQAEEAQDLSLVAIVRRIKAEKEKKTLQIVDAEVELYPEDRDNGQDE